MHKYLIAILATLLIGLSAVATGVDVRAWSRSKAVPIERATDFKATSWASPPCSLWVDDLFLKFELIPVNGCSWLNDEIIFA